MRFIGRLALLATTALLASCGAAHHRSVANRGPSCIQRAAAAVAAQTPAIAARHFAAASRAIERAARGELACAAGAERPAERFAARWRAANAFILSAELAHGTGDDTRAIALLRRGYALMHRLRPPRRTADLTRSLIAQRLDGARRDMDGQWVLW